MEVTDPTVPRVEWHGVLAREVLYSAPIDGTPSIQAIAQTTLSFGNTKNASLLRVSVEYDRRLRRTASHGQDARATTCHEWHSVSYWFGAAA